MKLIHILGAAALLAAATSCDSPSSLASKVEGTWSGNPERFDTKVVADGTYTPTYEFIRNDGKASGSIKQTAQISITLPMDNFPVDSLGNTPISATVAGVSTVSGAWTATDDDDITVVFDHNTLEITIDPDVEFEYANVLTQNDTPAVGALQQTVLDAVSRQMKKAMTDAISGITKLDDVKVKDDLLTLEIGKKHLSFSRVP